MSPTAPALPLRIPTPLLAVDLDVVERNIEAMAALMAGAGVALRPHVKTHSSSAVAALQIDGGASGLTVATIGMGERLVRSGHRDLFIANSIWAASAPTRLRALADAADLAVGFDSGEGAQGLAGAVAGAERRLQAVVEIDSGEHRAGVRPEDAGALATTAQRAGLEVIGAFTHGGHSYARPGTARCAGDDEVTALATAARALSDAGIEPRVLSAGSTPSAGHSARPPVSEQRPGTYVFGDRQQLELGAVGGDALALFAVATVVSTAVPGQVVLDGGAKSLAKDRPDWLPGFGLLPEFPDARVARLYDYHAVVEIPAGSPAPRLGERVAVVPNHACAAVNLSDELVVLRSGKVVDRWPVDLRARS